MYLAHVWQASLIIFFLYFFAQQSFNPLSTPLDCTFNTIPSGNIEEFLCDEDQVCGLLLSLDCTKSIGPDGISAKMSKFTAFSIAPAVSQLFNLSIRLSKLPDVWKLSLVVPVPKSAKKNLPSNYRPIYPMSILSKV